MSALRTASICAIVIAASLAAPAGARAATDHSLPTSTVYLPNITRMLGGPTGWQTPFIVQNIGAAPTDLEISFYGFSDGSLVATRNVSALRPGTSYALVPNNEVDLPANGQFGVVVRSYGSDVVAVVNEHAGIGARAEALSYVGISAGSPKISLPYFAKDANGWLTTSIVQNLGVSPTVVTASFLGYDRTTKATLTRRIEPGRSAFIDPRTESALLPGYEYSVTLTADQAIAAVVNAHNDAPSVAAPRAFSYSGVASSQSTATYYPFAARNGDGGRVTRLIIQNVGTGASPAAVVFQRPNDDPRAFTSSAPLRPGEALSVDVADRLTDGEYGLVVRPAEIGGVTFAGAEFAVLGITTNATTAMGSTGSAAPSKRLFLPNVTRTLGGASGWTTPIVLESAGAMNATLSWYRFSDGTLVSTQKLTGLALGRSVRIDPRSLSFLQDNVQYSVVIDGADGNVAALVLEYSDSGGDGAMAYEAFPAPPVSAPATPTAPVAYDPNTYFKGLPGYTYGSLDPALDPQFRQAFQPLYGKFLLDGASREVTQNGTLVAIALAFTINPDVLAQPGARDALLADLSSSGAMSLQLGGQTVYYKDGATVKIMFWIQKNYLVFLYGAGHTTLDPLATALITANR